MAYWKIAAARPARSESDIRHRRRGDAVRAITGFSLGPVKALEDKSDKAPRRAGDDSFPLMSRPSHPRCEQQIKVLRRLAWSGFLDRGPKPRSILNDLIPLPYRVESTSFMVTGCQAFGSRCDSL
jgi:hypothetical protein